MHVHDFLPSAAVYVRLVTHEEHNNVYIRFNQYCSYCVCDYQGEVKVFAVDVSDAKKYIARENYTEMIVH